MNRIFLLPILALLPCAVAQATGAPYVLAIGVNQTSDANSPLSALRFADDDAAEAVSLFASSVSRSWLHTVMDQSSQQRFPVLRGQTRPPTLAALKQSINEMHQRLQQEVKQGRLPVVVVWLSGHAAVDQDGRMAFPLLSGRLTPRLLITEVIAPLSVAHRVHLVVDTCYAEALLQTKTKLTVKRTTPQQAEQGFMAQSLSAYPQVGVLLGTSSGNRGFEWSEINSGVFSALVRAGIRGAADANGDDTVVYSELLAFVAAAAQGVALPEARPQVQVRLPPLETDAPLSKKSWLGQVALLSNRAVNIANNRPVHVLDGAGRWLLAGSFEPGFAPHLWLPSDRVLFLRTGSKEYRLDLSSISGQWVVNPIAQQETQSRSLVGQALQRGLFQTPYGPSFYGGYRSATASPAPLAESPGGFEPYALGIGLASAGVLTGMVTAVSLVVAGAGALQYTGTDLERPAHEGFTQLCVASGVAAGTGLVAAGFAVGAIFAWPSE